MEPDDQSHPSNSESARPQETTPDLANAGSEQPLESPSKPNLNEDEAERQHKKLKKYKLGELWLRPPAPRESPLPQWLRQWGLQLPDISRNPALWFHNLSYGGLALRQLRDFISQFQPTPNPTIEPRALIIGDCAPWICWEFISKHPLIPVDVIVRDSRTAEWVKEHIRLRAGQSADWITIAAGYDSLLQSEPRPAYTAVIWAFVSDAKQRQLELLQKILTHMADHSCIHYAEACAPSENNLEKWSKLRFRTTRLRGAGRDRWTFRRDLAEDYKEDSLRIFAFKDEEQLWHSLLEAQFETVSHGFVRPTLDTSLSGFTVQQMRYFHLYFLSELFFDWFYSSIGWLQGARRISTLERRRCST